MIQFKQMICPVSPERVDENRVRVTALSVVIIMGVYFMTGNTIFPAFLVIDFYIRAFTKLKYSPLSWLSHLFVKSFGTQPVWIPKAPKIFAARIGLLLTMLTTISAMLGLSMVAYVTGATLVIFAFLECGVNFCAGCWIYTYVVYPLVRKDH
jgi:hypothetical protein